MGSESKKNQIACRVSRETYQKVRALTEGENPPFESVSEYLTTLIAADLGRRGGTVPGGAIWFFFDSEPISPQSSPLCVAPGGEIMLPQICFARASATRITAFTSAELATVNW